MNLADPRAFSATLSMVMGWSVMDNLGLGNLRRGYDILVLAAPFRAYGGTKRILWMET
jgi:hypothetical protein